MPVAVFQLILLALQAAPSLIDSGRDLFAAIEGGLTDEQRAQLQIAQGQAHEALQAAVARAVAEEQGAAPASGVS